MTIDIEIKGLRQLKKQLDPKVFDRRMVATMHGAADLMRAGLKEYPEPPSAGDKARAVAAWTPKQRGWFFWALKHGKIEVPYRRGQSPGSEKLGASWTKRVRRGSQGIVATIGTKASYARLVMDDKRQATIHRGRWQTVQKVMKDKQREVKRFFEIAVKRWVK